MQKINTNTLNLKDAKSFVIPSLDTSTPKKILGKKKKKQVNK